MVWPGEDQAWNDLSALDPAAVAQASGAVCDGSGCFSLSCFGQEFRVLTAGRTVSAMTPLGMSMLDDVSEFFRLSILFYLTGAKDIPLSHSLVRPSDIPGGDIFARGTHVLPLPDLCSMYDQRHDAFLEKGRLLGGREEQYGDAAVMLFPFPRVPVVVIIWAGDEEFPAQASLLFDSTCSLQLSTDILWSTAMMTIELLSRG